MRRDEYPVDEIGDVLRELLELQKQHGLSNIFNLYLERQDDDASLSRSFDGDKISIDIVHAGMDEGWYQFVEQWKQYDWTLQLDS